MVPFDDKSPFITSGIRIGTAASTTRGMQEADMVQIVEWIDALIMNPDSESLKKDLKKQIQDFAASFPLFSEMR